MRYQEKCVVILAEVPTDPDFYSGPRLADEVFAVLVLRGLVDLNGGEAGGAGVSVEQGGHQRPGVTCGTEDNLIWGRIFHLLGN